MTATCDCSTVCQFDDQFQPATRELMVFTKSKTRYFDLDAVREPSVREPRPWELNGKPQGKHAHEEGQPRSAPDWGGTSPPLDWWLIPYTEPTITPRQGDPMTATFYVGDAIETMNSLPEKSVDLVLTSPPFLALRSYLPADHPDKAKEGGSQATPGEYVDWLLDVVEACARVLAPHGSLCFELGDTYSGSGGAGGDYAENGLRDGQPTFRQVGSREHRPEREGTGADGGARHVPASGGRGWPLAKSLSLIPETFRFAMVYGVNPHTGRRTAPWRLRNVIRWVRPNPPVGALGDKFRPATSELMVFCKAKDRYFDLDAVREPHKPHGGNYRSSTKSGIQGYSGFSRDVPHRIENEAGAPPLDWWNIPLLEGEEPTKGGPKEAPAKRDDVGPKRRSTMDGGEMGPYFEGMSGGAPPLDWWNIPPGGYPGAHYAVWPPELLIKPIKAMCPEKVCRTCGEPSRRIVGEAEYVQRRNGQLRPDKGGRSLVDHSQDAYRGLSEIVDGTDQSMLRVASTLGFSDCSHNDWRPGLVLDPFAGSGTTLSVATGHGRDAIGIDLDERNYDLALDRVGPFILTRGEIPV